jgi:hypothetical protein
VFTGKRLSHLSLTPQPPDSRYIKCGAFAVIDLEGPAERRSHLFKNNEEKENENH